MGWIREGQSIDACIGRGCGGWLRGVGTEVHDGETAMCVACKREHTFHVVNDGGPVRVEIEKKTPAYLRWFAKREARS